MADVTCAHCQLTAAGLDRAPLPGDIGKLILDRTCAACWKEWLPEQVKLMNENGLTPANPEHYELLVKEMKKFLKL